MTLSLVESRQFQLTDEQWRIVASYLPRQYQARILNNTGDYRAFIEAVLWAVDNNAPWTSVPKGYGSWRAIYVRFLRWCEGEHWIAVERAVGMDSRLAVNLRERIERYRASNRWRRKRTKSPAANSDAERELAGVPRPWGILKAC
jgi:transposase